MPKAIAVRQAKTSTKPQKAGASEPSEPKPTVRTIEIDGYLSGLYAAFNEQVGHYQHITHQLLSLEAQAEIAEKNLRVTRDHLAFSVDRAKTVTIPRDWTDTLNSVRFVGMRLADACVALLKDHKRLTSEMIFAQLNHGMFRFRTSAPLREIHGALLRHPFATKDGAEWVWSEAGDQISMHLRVVGSDATQGQAQPGRKAKRVAG
jgi:hypothetical protein